MLELRKGRDGELLEILDFINMVFSMDDRTHNFQRLLPKLYNGKLHTEDQHYLAVEDGKIKAVVCVVPIKIQNGEIELICGTVGNVSTHPSCTGKGYMQKVMNFALKDMQDQGMDFSYLSGQRQRYAYFGYEKTGIYYEYKVSRANFKHYIQGEENCDIVIHKVKSENSDVDKLWKLHQKQALFVQRNREEFIDICRSWNGSLYEIREKNKSIGYVCSLGSSIAEYILEDYSRFGVVLKRYSEIISSDELTIRVSALEYEKCEQLSKFCEEWAIKADGNYRFFDLQRVLTFYLSTKAKQEKLLDGRLILEISGRETFLIQVVNNKIKIELTEEMPEYTISESEAARILFSMEPVVGIGKKIREKYNWFPLPLTINEVDKC